MLLSPVCPLTAFSALGCLLLVLQTLLFPAAGSALTLVSGAAVPYATRQPRMVAA